MNAPTARLDLLVSVVMPLRDDAPILARVVEETSAVLTAAFTHHEIVLVADGLDDATLACADSVLATVPHVRLLALSREFGRSAALLAGLETSIGDYVVTLVPETDPPALIPEMVAKCRAEEGMVNGVDARGMNGGPVRLLLKRGFHAYMRRFAGAEMLPATTDFHVLSRRLVNALTQYPESARHLRLLTTTVGYRRSAFPYTPLSRSGRSARRSLAGEIGTGLDILFTQSRQPLRWVALLGWLAALLNVFSAAYTVAVYMWKEDVAPGWTTLSLHHSGMFFLLFSLLALLSEYLGRFFEEGRGRPRYFIGEEKNSAVPGFDPESRNVVRRSD